MPDPSDPSLPPDTAGLGAQAAPMPTPGQPTGAPSGPSGSPMLTPQKPSGKQASGKVKVQIAIHALQLAMLDVGASSPEGKAILKAIGDLVKEFGKTEEQSKSLMPAEIQQIMQKSKPPGAPQGAPKPPMPAAA